MRPRMVRLFGSWRTASLRPIARPSCPCHGTRTAASAALPATGRSGTRRASRPGWRAGRVAAAGCSGTRPHRLSQTLGPRPSRAGRPHEDPPVRPLRQPPARHLGAHLHTGRPHRGRRWDELPVAEHHVVRSHFGHRRAEPHVDAALPELICRDLRSLGENWPRTWSVISTSTIRTRSRSSSGYITGTALFRNSARPPVSSRPSDRRRR